MSQQSSASGREPGQPEVLEQGSGSPLAAERGRRGRTGLLVGGGVLAAALLAGGGAAAFWYLSSGAAAAEAMPADTIGFVGVNLDPSGQQKLEALQTLKKFPAISEKLGLDGDLGEVDVKRSLFEALDTSGSCDLAYEADFASWLGDRAGLGAVVDGDGEPAPVAVVEVSDEGAARATLTKIGRCGGLDDAGYVVDGGWLTIADSTEQAQQAADDAADSSLADDADFQRLTGEAGGDGLVTMYAAPDAPKVLASAQDGMLDLGPAQQYLDRFQGAAGSVRFADSGLQVDVAGTFEGAGDLLGDNQVGELVSSLPASTGAAYGLAVPADVISEVIDSLAPMLGTASGQEAMTQLSEVSGLDLPADAQTLLSQGVVLSVDGGVDPQALFSSSDARGLPVGARIGGDPVAIEKVLAKVRPRLGSASYLLDGEAGDGFLAVGPDADYRSSLTQDGELSSSDAFSGVVPDAGAAAGVLYLDADALAEVASTFLGGSGSSQDREMLDNLEPLRAVGASSTVDGDTVHLVLRATTD